MSEQEKSKTPCLLERTVSIRPATTTDGFEVLADKHYTADIEKGTLEDAIRKGYVDKNVLSNDWTMKP